MPTKRLASLLLLLWFAFGATGLAMHFHEAQHDREDAELVAAAMASHKPISAPPAHDDSNCQIHAQLHMPLLAGDCVIPLICLGLWVAFLSLIQLRPCEEHPPVRLVCRGPPLSAALWP